MENTKPLRESTGNIEITPDKFRRLGHETIDRIAELLGSMQARKITPSLSPSDVRELLSGEAPLPDTGRDVRDILTRTCDMLFDNSLYNGHPRFWGYITSSAAPIGILAEAIVAAVNANCGAWKLSPVATEIELQTVRWIAGFMGYPADCGGVLVSGGNMANFTCFLAARAAHAGWDVRADGFANSKAKQLVVYVSAETHTWVQKAADMFGLGTGAIRWIGTDEQQRMDIDELRGQIEADRRGGLAPFMVVGTAGSVSTGAIDPLPELARLCREQNLWFHVDGAYGGLAAAVPEVHDDIRGLTGADSVAVDPHKWLYAPLEAGCALVRDPEHLRAAFSYHPPYYHFGEEAVNLVDYGPQNSRGFRALKVWLAFQQLGRAGYTELIREDISLSRHMFNCVKDSDSLQAFSQSLSITTFRFIPADLKDRTDDPEVETYLDDLNKEILFRLEKGGEVFVSNAVLDGRFLLRACIVNFRTTRSDVEALPAIVQRVGLEADAAMRSEVLKG